PSFNRTDRYASTTTSGREFHSWPPVTSDSLSRARQGPTRRATISMKQEPLPIALPARGVRPWSISSLKYYRWTGREVRQCPRNPNETEHIRPFRNLALTVASTRPAREQARARR